MILLKDHPHKLTRPSEMLTSATNPRVISTVYLHCTASSPNATPDGILNFWQRTRGWDRPGYHYLILADGTLLGLYPERELTYGVRGHNAHSIHLSYMGGIDFDGRPLDTRTPDQRVAMSDAVRHLLTAYPGALIYGHYAKAAKACPSFDVPAWLGSIGVASKHIGKHPRAWA